MDSRLYLYSFYWCWWSFTDCLLTLPDAVSNMIEYRYVIRLETKFCRILPLTYFTKYDMT